MQVEEGREPLLRGIQGEAEVAAERALLAALGAGRDPWPGMHGFDTTVIPQVERALIAGHDIVLLGERGQGKTRLLRSLALQDGFDAGAPLPVVVLANNCRDGTADAVRDRLLEVGIIVTDTPEGPTWSWVP